MKLSDNLTLQEVLKSNTATRLGIDNNPTNEHLINLIAIAKELFQPIRDYFCVPIHISSGYRSPELNKAIGGSSNSQHSKGQALDIDQDNKNSPVRNVDIFNFIYYELEFDQLIWEFGNEKNPAWVHVSYVNYDQETEDSPNRRQVLVAYKEDGKTKYKDYDGSSRVC